MNESKKTFVDFLFSYLERNFDYLILRNYENLPFDEGHDIDLLIEEDDLYKIEILLSSIKKQFSVDVYKNYRYKDLKSHIIVFEDDILHLDFFTAINWNNTPLFDTRDLLERKELFKDKYWIINKNDFQRYCWFLYIIRNKQVKPKYIKNALYYDRTNTKQPNLTLTDDSLYKQKLILFLYFLKKNPVKTINNTFRTLSFKLSKLLNPYGRIFIKETNSYLTEKCSTFCFLGKQEYLSSEKRYSHLLKIYLALVDERAVFVSKNYLERNPLTHFIFKKFIILNQTSLRGIVYKIFNE